MIINNKNSSIEKMDDSQNELIINNSINNYDDLNYEEIDDASDLPKSLIITNVDTTIFSPGPQRDQFEGLFKQYDENATFQYFKSFKRARVNYTNPWSTAKARIMCHQMKVGDSIINCYFSQMDTPPNKDCTNSGNYLHPPPLTRQFLISPPASPPVGWHPCDEAEPIINYELLAAISNLSPGEAHELHPQSESHPGIVVHICEDEQEDEIDHTRLQMRIQQTRRPPISSQGSEESLESV